MAGPLGRARQNIVPIVSTLVTGTWLAALLTGQGWWLPFMLVGYVVVVPLTAMLFGDPEQAHTGGRVEEDTSDRATEQADGETDEDDPLQTLRDRYARGELTDAEFERKVERLLETDSPESSPDRTVDRVERELERE